MITRRRFTIVVPADAQASLQNNISTKLSNWSERLYDPRDSGVQPGVARIIDFRLHIEEGDAADIKTALKALVDAEPGVTIAGHLCPHDTGDQGACTLDIYWPRPTRGGT